MSYIQLVSYQPYRKFEFSFINQLIKQENFYLVAQSYSRANHEMTDHTKTPVLFTAYKKTEDAVSHYGYLQNKGDSKAAYVDIRKGKVTARLSEMCYGLSDTVPYISLVANLQQTNNYIARHYYEQIRSWVKNHRNWWIIREPNSLQSAIITLMGEPWVRIKWGSHFANAALEDLEKL